MGEAKFRCWMPSFGETSDDARDVGAFDAWSASRKFAEWADGDSGAEMSQNGLRPGHDGYVVHVLSPDNVETKWRVWPEAEVRVRLDWVRSTSVDVSHYEIRYRAMSTSGWTEADQAYADFVSEIACEVSADDDVVADILGALEERGLFSVSEAAAWIAQEYGPTPAPVSGGNTGEKK